jgi:2,4-dienoyl-CoA reductase-like NADH-dependent reductase (Old Yellow Enzyme family)
VRDELFDAFRLGPFALPDRVVMAVDPKSRTAARHVRASAAEYYRQRALNEWDRDVLWRGAKGYTDY